jgi:hypothetical protein
MSTYKQWVPIGIESDVAYMFNQMVKASKLTKTEFLLVLMNNFNEHDIQTRIKVDNKSPVI